MKKEGGDNDLVGFVFSFQDINNFYVVYSAKDNNGENQGPWRLTRVKTTNAPSTQLQDALFKSRSVPGQTEVLWTDPGDNGWKPNVAYKVSIEHRPKKGTIHVKIYEGPSKLADSGKVASSGLAGGRVGVFVASQPQEIWSKMSYKCIEE